MQLNPNNRYVRYYLYWRTEYEKEQIIRNGTNLCDLVWGAVFPTMLLGVLFSAMLAVCTMLVYLIAKVIYYAYTNPTGQGFYEGLIIITMLAVVIFVFYALAKRRVWWPYVRESIIWQYIVAKKKHVCPLVTFISPVEDKDNVVPS